MPHDRAEGERGVIRRALGLNAAMVVVGLAAGLAADSLGLVADSLDILAIAALSLLVNAHVIREALAILGQARETLAQSA